MTRRSSKADWCTIMRPPSDWKMWRRGSDRRCGFKGVRVSNKRKKSEREVEASIAAVSPTSPGGECKC